MFQRLLWVSTRLGGHQPAFRARSADRDKAIDIMRLEKIRRAIDDALHEAEQEQLGLNRRISDVLARASVTFGNGDDEYLERELLDSHHQDLFDSEIKQGQQRLHDLARSIANYRVIKEAFSNRFPDCQF